MKFSHLRLKLGRAKRAEHLIEIIQSAFKFQRQPSSTKTMSAAPDGRAQASERDEDLEQNDPARLVGMLRELLASERANSEQRRQNSALLQRYVQRLKEDQLRLQSDLEQALQFGHKVKAQKEVQIECLETNLKQKDELVEQLKAQLSNLDETRLRSEFKAVTDKLQEHHQLELEQLRKQVELDERQLSCEQANIEKQARQFQQKLDDQSKLHEQELALLRGRLEHNQRELERVLDEPQNLIIKALREDKRHLDAQVQELNLSLEENQTKFDSMRRRLETILAEQESLAKQNQEELERLQQSNAEQRRTVNELKSEVEDKQETIQLVEFNLTRSEKRVENLLNVLKEKEATYRELINKSETEHGEEVERLSKRLQTAERRMIELESELVSKQNELVAVRLDQENRLESMRNDRDERLGKLVLEKEDLAREVQSLGLKLACECEQSQHRLKQVEQLLLEVRRHRDDNSRLSIELTKRETKCEIDQRDLLAAKRELLELESANGSSSNQTLRGELEEERANSRKLRTNMDSLRRDNDKLCAKLRIAESNLLKMRSAVNREHEKMMREYEKRLESIKSEQAAFDKNRLRYKRYGYKLKKYCEHLRRVHSHLCTSASCGYFIGSTNGSIGSKRSPAYVNCDSTDLLDSDGDARGSDSPYYDEISGDEDDPNPPRNLVPPVGRKAFNTNSKTSTKPAGRFIIKRTSSTISSPPIRTNQLNVTPSTQKSCPRAPLRPKNTNSMPSLGNSCKQPVQPIGQSIARLPGSRGTENPFYYYNSNMATKSTSIQAKRPTPVERRLVSKLASPTLRSSNPSKLVKPPIQSTEL